MAIVVFEPSTSITMEVDDSVIQSNLERIVGQIFRLLPAREEGKDWIKPLETLIIEIAGMADLVGDRESLFTLLCKLDGLLVKKDDIDFMLFRRTIFETCNLANEVKESYKCQ